MNAMGEIQFATVDGVSIRYVRNDEGSGVPILLTSPWPESILAFYAIWPEMKQLGPLLAVDLPGFGLSESRDDLLTPSAMGDFVTRLADKFGLTRFHAVGPNIGTAAMLFAASRKPELFESIVVGSGGTDMELVGQGLRGLINMPAKDIDGGEDGEHVVARIKILAKRPVPKEQLSDYGRASAHGTLRDGRQVCSRLSDRFAAPAEATGVNSNPDPRDLRQRRPDRSAGKRRSAPEDDAEMPGGSRRERSLRVGGRVRNLRTARF